MAGERHGHGMGTAWARHAMGESAFHVPTVLKYGSLIRLETSGPVLACTEIAFPLLFILEGIVIYFV